MPKIVPELVVSDIEASKAFYESLGFAQEMIGIVDDTGSQWYSMALGEASVQLIRQDVMEKEGYDPTLQRAPGVHLYLEVDDVDALYTALQGKVNITKEIETQWYGQREFRVVDPDGYIWTLNMPVSEPAKDVADGQN